MDRLAAAALSTLVLLAATAAADAGGLAFDEAWISASPPGVNVNAAYLTIRNPTGDQVTLVAVTSPRIARVEMHLSEVRDGVARMRRLDAVPIPAGSALEFAPLGYHLMLFDASPSLRAGEVVPLTFVFNDGTTLDVPAPVERRDPAGTTHVH